MAEVSIGDRTRAGLKWTTLGMVSVRLSRFGANVVLAHLLARDAFGVMAMANAVIAVAGSLREAGIGQAYVQREDRAEDRPREAIDTVFALSLAVNVALTALLFAAAPFAASLVTDEAATVQPVLRALALLFLLDAFDSTPRFLLQRAMRFDLIARSEFLGAAANAVTAIGSAALGAGVWSLVLGYVADKAATTASLVLGSGWRPGAGASRRMARELLAFGKFLWGFALVRSIGGVLDRVVVGRRYGSSRLGDYSLAYQLCTLPSNAIAQLVNRVSLPAMSRMQSDPERLRAAFLKSLGHVAFLAVPLAAGLIVISDLLVPVVYGEKWLGMVPLVQVLALYGMLVSVASVCGPVLQAVGRPGIFFTTEIARQGALVALLVAFASRGEVAVAWSVVAAFGVVTGPAFLVVVRMIGLRTPDVVPPLTGCVASAAAMYGSVRLVRSGLGDVLSAPLLLGAAVLTGLVSYAVLSLVLNRSLAREFLQTVRQVGGSRAPAVD